MNRIKDYFVKHIKKYIQTTDSKIKTKQYKNTLVDNLTNELLLNINTNEIKTTFDLDKLKYQNAIAYFKNGILYRVFPAPTGNLYDDRDVAYQARFIVNDGIKHDLLNIHDIITLKIPSNFKSFSDTKIGVVGSIDYILKMITRNFIKIGVTNQGALLTLITYKFMKNSPVEWQTKDFKRLLINLYECGQFDIADKLESTFLNKTKNLSLDINNSLNSGYFEASYFTGCCAECAKYRGRWYSNIDKKYPDLPQTYNCSCQGLTFSSVIPGASTPTVEIFINKKINIIKYSNRPFIDDRTEKEKQIYNDFIKNNKRQLNEEKDYYANKKMFYQLVYYYPQQAPKSYRSFMYTKRNKPTEFNKLKQLIDSINN